MKRQYDRQELITIISGLLASGHYTELRDDELECIPELKTMNVGKDWKEYEGQWGFYQNRAIVDAIEILHQIPRALRACTWDDKTDNE